VERQTRHQHEAAALYELTRRLRQLFAFSQANGDRSKSLKQTVSQSPQFWKPAAPELLRELPASSFRRRVAHALKGHQTGHGLINTAPPRR